MVQMCGAAYTLGVGEGDRGNESDDNSAQHVTIAEVSECGKAAGGGVYLYTLSLSLCPPHPRPTIKNRC